MSIRFSPSPFSEQTHRYEGLPHNRLTVAGARCMWTCLMLPFPPSWPCLRVFGLRLFHQLHPMLNRHYRTPYSVPSVRSLNFRQCLSSSKSGKSFFALPGFVQSMFLTERKQSACVLTGLHLIPKEADVSFQVLPRNKEDSGYL